MSAHKHTPGEWFMFRQGYSTVYVECRIGGGFVQEIAACGPTEAGPEQQEANARLIAAAPKLLEALVLALPYVTDAEGFPEQFKPGVVARHVAQILAAIAKATGEPA